MLVGAMSGPLGATTHGGRRGGPGRPAAGRPRPPPPLALPGQDKAGARYDVRLTVGDDAELHWLPEQLISAHGSDLHVTTRVDLAAEARFLLREEQVLGRSGEEPGRLTSRLTVRIAGRCVLDQELACGPGAPGAAGTVRPGWRGTVPSDSLVVVRPEFAADPPAARAFAEGVAVMPLAGPAVLVTAVAPDALLLRRLLEEASDALG